MSTPIPSIPHQSPTTFTTTSTSSVGLGYGIAIAVSILVLISTIMLASYACVRIKSSGGARHRHPVNHNDNHNDNDNDDVSGSERQGRPTVTGLPGPFVLVQAKKGVLYPEVVLGESKRLPKPNNGPCSICLSEYKPKQTVRCMPDCNHCFHVSCIDQWLKMSPTCPLCRNSPAPSAAPTPAGTPLSELAFYPRWWIITFHFYYFWMVKLINYMPNNISFGINRRGR